MGSDCLQQVLLLGDGASDQPRNTLLFHFSIVKIHWIAKNGNIFSVLGTRQGNGATHGDDQVSRVRKPLHIEEEDLMYAQYTQETVDSSSGEAASLPQGFSKTVR